MNPSSRSNRNKAIPVNQSEAVAPRHPNAGFSARLAVALPATALLASALLAGCGSGGRPSGVPTPSRALDGVPIEWSLSEMAAALENGRSCEDIAAAYVERIESLDQAVLPAAGGLPLNSIVAINPLWREQAQALDAEYAQRGPRGPLHCAPVILKDLYDSFDFPTTAASLSLAGSQPPDDAHSVAGLRRGGALILAKAAMTEFAYFTQSYNSATLRIANPYDTQRDAGGSSGGSASAIAANFALLGTGSDTCASIRLPPSNAALVGVRATVGLVSQDGLVPLSHTQDVGGPITRTVRDAALMLDAMAGVDPRDVRTLDPERRQPASYAAGLRADALLGARIGVLRSYGGSDAFGDEPGIAALMQAAATDLAAAGAEIVDPVELPDFDGVSVIVQEFADHLDEYLASFDAPRANTVEVFASGLVHPVIEALIGASLAARDTQSAGYREALERREQMRDYVEAEMDRLGLDALIYPPVLAPAQPTGQLQGSNCGFSATTGMPSVVVPAGLVEGLPVGLEIFGRRWDEARLLAYAHAYELATAHRQPPPAYTP